MRDMTSTRRVQNNRNIPYRWIYLATLLFLAPTYYYGLKFLTAECTCCFYIIVPQAAMLLRTSVNTSAQGGGMSIFEVYIFLIHEANNIPR